MYETELPDELLRDTAMFKLFERRLAWVRSLHLYSQATAAYEQIELTVNILAEAEARAATNGGNFSFRRRGAGAPAAAPARPSGPEAARLLWRIVRIQRRWRAELTERRKRAQLLARRGTLADMHAAMVAQARRRAVFQKAHLVQLPLVGPGAAPTGRVALAAQSRRKTRVSLTTGDAAGGLALQRASRRLSAVTALAGTIRTSLSTHADECDGAAGGAEGVGALQQGGGARDARRGAADDAAAR
jgi:hypothetical protein